MKSYSISLVGFLYACGGTSSSAIQTPSGHDTEPLVDAGVDQQQNDAGPVDTSPCGFGGLWNATYTQVFNECGDPPGVLAFHPIEINPTIDYICGSGAIDFTFSRNFDEGSCTVIQTEHCVYDGVVNDSVYQFRKASDGTIHGTWDESWTDFDTCKAQFTFIATRKP